MMKNLLILGFALILITGMASATTTTVDWDGAGSISTVFENDKSRAEIHGFGNDIKGTFRASDGNYGRVEIKEASAVYDNGRYEVVQDNELKDGSMSRLHVFSDSLGEGFINMKTDAWRTGNSLKTNGYGGKPWSWSGTDEQAFGASNGDYAVGVYAGRDTDNDGTPDKEFNLEINGNGNVGVGTERAGSNTVLSASGLSADMIIRGSGDASMKQNMLGAGSIEQSIAWN